MSGLPPTAAKERAAESLRHVGLYEERYRQIGTYSTGMKQRVKLAQALAGDPRLLLLDEPTNGLDPVGRNAMLELIARIGEEFGISIVVASHLLSEIERVCDHLVAIEGGHLLRADTLSSFTGVSQTLVVEVEEGVASLLEELARRGLAPRAYQRSQVLVPPRALVVWRRPAVITAVSVAQGNPRAFGYDTYRADLRVLIMLIFVAVQAPELVSRDLRSRVLPLYFSRPLKPVDYPLAKYLAFT